MNGLPLASRWFALALIVPALSGCLSSDEWDGSLADSRFMLPEGDWGNLTAADIVWPDFEGYTLRILDHGAFPGCADMGALFGDLTNATVECTSADDTGSALNRAIAGAGDPEFDVLYGVDNLLLHRALEADIFQAYTPQLASRVNEDYVFFDDQHDDHEHAWPATPVDHGYIALNVDHNHPNFRSESGPNVTIANLFNVRTHAESFVTQDPRTSTPGLGFLVTTVQLFGENDAYDWQDYWTELFENGVKITPDWSSAYETHFSGGYGVWTDGHLGDRPIVTSYVESPAFEAFYEATEVADVLLNHGFAPASLHQIQTMAILAGTPNRAIAEAWIEFTLTDDFQVTVAPENAVYPVVDSDAAAQSVTDTYETNDNVTHYAPGSFDTISYDFLDDGEDVERWVQEWVALCEAHDCA